MDYFILKHKNGLVAHAPLCKKLSVLWPAFYLLKGNSVLLFQPKENEWSPLEILAA